MSGVLRIRRVVLAGVLAVTVTGVAQAQPVQVRGFFDVGGMTFTANDTFKAVLGSSTGIVFGGGGGVVLPNNVFASVRASRFRKNGERVFVQDGEVFDLGIANTITITPLEITGGYRFAPKPNRTRRPPARTSHSIAPYVGGGVSWYRYQETDEFAAAGDETDQRFTGYHLMGGVDIPIARWLGAAGEVQWTSVPNALGTNPGSAAAAFGETNLGGTTFRVKVVIGR